MDESILKKSRKSRGGREESRGSDATKVFVGLSKDGYERAMKRLPGDDCVILAEREKILNEPNAIASNHVVRYRFLDDESDHDWVFLIMDLCEETLRGYVERSSCEKCQKNSVRYHSASFERISRSAWQAKTAFYIVI